MRVRKAPTSLCGNPRHKPDAPVKGCPGSFAGASNSCGNLTHGPLVRRGITFFATDQQASRGEGFEGLPKIPVDVYFGADGKFLAQDPGHGRLIMGPVAQMPDASRNGIEPDDSVAPRVVQHAL